MITREELIAIGHYNKPHGVNGEISATVFVDIDVLRDLSCVVTEIDGIFVPFFINSLRPKTAETVLFCIDGINTEQQAARMVNRDIYALKRDYDQQAEDADADGYPLDYFIGFELQDSNGKRVGDIVEVNEQTENALFIIEGNEQEFMVPATDELIVEFDTEKKVMVMELPEGLLELND